MISTHKQRNKSLIIVLMRRLFKSFFSNISSYFMKLFFPVELILQHYNTDCSIYLPDTLVMVRWQDISVKMAIWVFCAHFVTDLGRVCFKITVILTRKLKAFIACCCPNLGRKNRINQPNSRQSRMGKLQGLIILCSNRKITPFEGLQFRVGNPENSSSSVTDTSWLTSFVCFRKQCILILWEENHS